MFCTNVFLGLAEEKKHENLVHGIEDFQKGQLKTTQTQEKNPLPNPESKLPTCPNMVLW